MIYSSGHEHSGDAQITIYIFHWIVELKSTLISKMNDIAEMQMLDRIDGVAA